MYRRPTCSTEAADEGVVAGSRHVHALHGQVLAEGAVLERVPELFLPPVHVFAGVCIGRLVRSAVELAARLVVARQVDPADGDAALDRGLPDGGRLDASEPFDFPRRADVDGEHPPAHGKGASSLTKPGRDSTRSTLSYRISRWRSRIRAFIQFPEAGFS